MKWPDFARTDLSELSDRDVRFLVEHFPSPGQSYEEIARVLGELPTTIDSMISSQALVDKVLYERHRILTISPFLLFNVLLRQVSPEVRDALERRVIHYLANLLALFVRAERVYRVEEGDPETYEYLVELIAEGNRAGPQRRFLVQAHIGNYALYLTGLFWRWLEHRYRFGRRPIDPDYYAQLGSSGFRQAAADPRAAEHGLDDVFLRLSLGFDRYRQLLYALGDRWLFR